MAQREYEQDLLEFEQHLHTNSPEAVVWDAAGAVVESLLARGFSAPLRRFAERLEQAERAELATFFRAALDLQAFELEGAAARLVELEGRSIPSFLPRIYLASLRHARQDPAFEQALDALAAAAVGGGQPMCERELLLLGDLLFRCGRAVAARQVLAVYRRSVGAPAAAARLATALLLRTSWLEAAQQATRALLSWPPPAQALAVLAQLCREKGYGEQALELQEFAQRREEETSGGAPARKDATDTASARTRPAVALVRDHDLRSAQRRAGDASAERLDREQAYPAIVRAAVYFIEDYSSLLALTHRLLKRCTRCCPGASDLALRTVDGLVARGALRSATQLLQRAYAAASGSEERDELHRRLGEIQSQVDAGVGGDAGASVSLEDGSPGDGPPVAVPEVGANLQGTARVLSANLARLLPIFGPCGPVDRMLTTLAMPMRRSILLVGQSGVGKTAMVHEMVRRIQRGECPESLRGFRVVELTVQDFMSGTEYVGSLQTKMGKILHEASVDRRILLYLSDVAFTVGAGSYDQSDYDVAASLMPAIARSEILVIGEALPEELRVARTRRPEIVRWFETFEVREPGLEQTRRIIAEGAWHLAEDSGVEVSSEAQMRLVDLSGRLLPGRGFPGKAVELLIDLVRSHEGGAGVIESQEVVEAFARRSGLPRAIFVDSEDLDLQATESFFTDRVLGQGEAVRCVVDQLAMIKAGMTRPGRPLGSFFFVGPTGIGKTELARALAAFLFGSEERLVRLDMSEFSAGDAVWRLTGTPSRHYDPGSRALLTEPVREQPFSVVLLDEIEKAAPQVFDLLLQVLDAGRLTDARGTVTNFCNTIIIMTSNIGTQTAQEEALGFGGEVKGRTEIVRSMESHFRPEFLNRIGRIVYFRALSREDMRKIAYREIGRVLEREGILRRRLTVEMDPPLADYVLEHGFSPRYGARHLQRAVEERVSVPLARTLVQEKVHRDATLRIFVRDGRTAVEVVPAELPASTGHGKELRADRTARPFIRHGRLRAEFEEHLTRLRAIEQRVCSPEAEERRGALEEEMASPSFWDHPRAAAAIQHEYARLIRQVDRFLRLEREVEALSERLGSIGERADRSARMRGLNTSLERLRATLDTAEIESLLGAEADSLDAFLMISASSRRREAEEWVMSLVRMYEGLARRYRFEVRMLAERVPEGPSGVGVLLRVLGNNVFGYLRLEHGLHRVMKPTRGEERRRQSHTARVEVLPDAGEEDPEATSQPVEIRRCSPEAGLVIPRLSRRMVLSDRGSNLRSELLLPKSSETQTAVLTWWRASCGEAAGVARGPRRGDELVRVYRVGADSLVRDPWTGFEVRETSRVFAGGLHEFILVRLRKAHESLEAGQAPAEPSPGAPED